MNENLSPPVEERDSFRINPHESEYGTIIASILLLLDLEPRIRDSNSANSNVFLREWNNDISRYSRWEHRKLRRAFSRNIEFTEASQPSIYSSRKPTSPNFHASSLLWEYAALVKRGKFAVNFRQGQTCFNFDAGSDIIESRYDNILRKVEFEEGGWWKISRGKNIWENICAL